MAQSIPEIQPGYIFTSDPWWFPFDVNAWMTSMTIASMSDREYRTYLTLLCYQWKSKTCTLADNWTDLSKLQGIDSKCLVVNGRVLSNFIFIDGIFYNEKLFNARVDSEQISIRNRVNGSKGGRPRKPSGKPRDNPVGKRSDSQSKPSGKPVTVTDTVTDTNNVTVNVKGLTLTGDFTGYSNDEIVDICLGLEPETNRGPEQQEYWAKKVGYWTRQGKISQFMDQLYDATKSNVDNPASLLVKNTRVL